MGVQNYCFSLSPPNRTLVSSPPLLNLYKFNHVLFSSNYSSSTSVNINGIFSNLRYDPLFTTLSSKRNSAAGLKVVVASSSSSNVGAPLWDTWSPDNATPSPCLSDILWPSLGAFAAMAILGKMDQMLGPKGLSMTVAPLGAVCAVLFVTPKAPAARKYNMFMAQIGCAAIGVLAFAVFGPGWLARGAALAASLAFMISTRSTHPPAAGLPLLFIDGAKFHGLNFWYTLFPGAAGCIILSILQEMVYYLKENHKF